jgi:hypothetical protein
VQPSVSDRSRSGSASASSWAIIPPIEIPTTCALSSPSSSIKPAASSAISTIVKAPSIGADNPIPRLSKATTSKLSRNGAKKGSPHET